MRQTPFRQIRYPWAPDVVNAVDLQTMGADIDQELVQTADMAANFSRMATVVARRNAAQSISKGTLTTITFDAVRDNGADSALSGAWWSSTVNPSRLTAPVACVVLASAVAGVNATSAFGSPAALQITLALNGASGSPGVQGTKYQPLSTQSGQIWAGALTMWKLNAGDYLELKMYWTGTPAGPFNTDTAVQPIVSIMMVALPSVP